MTERLEPNDRPPLEVVAEVEPIDRVPGDPETTRWRRAARRHQAQWRINHGWPVGHITVPARGDLPQRTRPVGSKVDLDFALRTGCNFLNDDIVAAVRHRLDHPERFQTLGADRLWGDLLSSMPMCLNLFGPLWADPQLAVAVARRWFSELVPTDAMVTVRFEWSPGRADPAWLGDRTAFDAALDIVSPTGRTLIGIETKYHEHPGRDRKPKDPVPTRYREVSEVADLFRPPTTPDTIWGTRVEQVWRDHMLALAHQQHPTGPVTTRYVLAAPAANPSWRPLVEHYSSLLNDRGSQTVEYRSIDDLIVTARDLLPHATTFTARYLDVDLDGA